MANDVPFTLFGRLTKDPEISYTGNGLAVVNLTIASNPRKFDKQTNEWTDEPAMFIRASAWREFAENIANTCRQGMEVIAYGVLKNKPYQAQDGTNRDSLELELQNFGPDLRRATAAVTKTQTNQNQNENRAVRQQPSPQPLQGPGPRGQERAIPRNNGGQGQSPAQQQPVQHAGQQVQQEWAPEQPANGVVYEDETPW